MQPKMASAKPDAATAAARKTRNGEQGFANMVPLLIERSATTALRIAPYQNPIRQMKHIGGLSRPPAFDCIRNVQFAAYLGSAARFTYSQRR